MMLLSSRLSIFLLTAVTMGAVNCQTAETRQNYVPYPPDAISLLLEEVEDVGSPIGLEVVTSLATKGSSFRTYDLLKGVIHRLRNQNQIIHANPHFYISNGLDLGCRELIFDEDTGAEIEIEVSPTPAQCHGACTNHGRYCVVEQENFDPRADNSRGAMLVKETLLRICFVQIYHGSDLRFWEYMDEFERLGCSVAEDIYECSRRAVKTVPHADYPPLANCMETAGGLDQDGINVHLETEMEKQGGRHPYVLTDLPFIRMGGKKFNPRDSLDVPHIFEFVCTSYQEEKQVLPIACEFCGACRGVRACLWQLHCDGRPFVTSAYEDTIVPPVPSTVPNLVMPEPTFPPTAAFTTPSLAFSTQPIHIQSSETHIIDLAQTPPPVLVPSSPYYSTSEQESSASPSHAIIFQDVPTRVPDFNTEQKDSNTSGPTGPIISQGGAPHLATSNDQSDAIPYSDDEVDFRRNETLRPEEIKSDGENYYDADESKRWFMSYGLSVVVAFSIFGICFFASYLRQRHHDSKVNSAEEYFNDLMNESYRDNMAVSGRIEDEMSDRSMEDPNIDDMSGAAPPFASFKVHMVMN